MVKKIETVTVANKVSDHFADVRVEQGEDERGKFYNVYYRQEM